MEIMHKSCNTCGNILSPLDADDKNSNNHKGNRNLTDKSTRNNSFSNYGCSCCDLPFTKDSAIWVCFQCKQLLHESCTSLPHQIHHPFHPQHPLTLRPNWPPYAAARPPQCCACGGDTEGCTFHCSQCQFNLDVHCASLNVTHHIIQHFHQHNLIHCDKLNNFPHSCFGCRLPFEDSVLVCLCCSMLLHESCAKLPRQIVHPFHPNHSLTLFENSTIASQQSLIHCKACLNLSEGFGYRCCHCGFYMDIKCSFAYFPMIKSERHHHPLAMFNIISNQYRCKICYMPCNGPFFRCVGCNFNLHAHCLSNFPQTVKHRCHLHTLVFTNSRIRDRPDEDDNADFYCDACEDKRRLVDPTYYCEECHFVAHVHCVMSEVLPYLEKESCFDHKIDHIKMDASTNEITRDEVTTIEIEDIVSDPVLADKEIAMLQAEVDSLIAKLHKLKEIRAKHISSTKLISREVEFSDIA